MRPALRIATEIIFILCTVRLANSQFKDHLPDVAHEHAIHGDDLQIFVSRRDLRPPKFKVETHIPESVTPGYWFVAPYGKLESFPSSRLYEPSQIGPHIYDNSGELVWSGAQLFGDAVTFDFKTSIYRGSAALTFILKPDRFRRKNPEGGGIILDDSLKIQNLLLQAAGNQAPNMHEFTVTEQGTALMITTETEYYDMPSHERKPLSNDSNSVLLVDNGFREMRTESGNVIFDWRALEHVNPAESFAAAPQGAAYARKAWDWFHLNSIDKNEDGDYLISSRFMNCIYKISGQDGSIIWQLGGRRSSFILSGFNFSAQHDARFRSENSSHTVISFLNNAANSFKNTSAYSMAVTVSLNLQSMTATPISTFERPDHGLSHLRGNAQLLPNGNTFVCWSENALISEFDPQGKLVLQASFTSRRFVTYRAYKFNFTTNPSEAIAVEAFVYGTDEPGDGAIMSMYVSWNGATEVAFWRFYSWQTSEKYQTIGTANKTGFETLFMVAGVHCKIYVEALSVSGTVLGKSEARKTTLPPSWDGRDCSTLAAARRLPQSKVEDQSRPLGDSKTISFRFQLISGFSIFVLLLSLGAAVWKIQKLNLRLRDASAYEYTPLEKSP